MKRQFLSLLSVFLIVGSAATAHADHHLELSDELASLQCLVGEWEMEFEGNGFDAQDPYQHEAGCAGPRVADKWIMASRRRSGRDLVYALLQPRVKGDRFRQCYLQWIAQPRHDNDE